MVDGKARKGVLDDVPDTAVVPKGAYLSTIDEIEELESNTGKLMYKCTYVIVEPDDFANMHLWDYFVIGNDDDPEADDPKTWKKSIGARNLKRLMKKVGLDVAGRTIDELISEAESQKVVLSVSVQEDDEGDYAGQPRNRVVGYFSPGEREPGAEADDGDAAPAKKTTTGSAAAATGKGKVAAEDEPPPKAKGKQATAAAATAAAEKGNGSTKEAATAAPAAAAAEKPKEKMFECPDCHQQVPKSLFSPHMDSHES